MILRLVDVEESGDVRVVLGPSQTDRRGQVDLRMSLVGARHTMAESGPGLRRLRVGS